MGYFKNAEIEAENPVPAEAAEIQQLAFIPRLVSSCDLMEMPEEELLESFVRDEFTLPLLALQLLA